MPMIVCLHGNIYDEDGERRERGEAWEGSQDFADTVLAGDAEAGRQPRIAVIEPPKRKPGRPKKEDGGDEDQ